MSLFGAVVAIDGVEGHQLRPLINSDPASSTFPLEMSLARPMPPRLVTDLAMASVRKELEGGLRLAAAEWRGRLGALRTSAPSSPTGTEIRTVWTVASILARVALSATPGASMKRFGTRPTAAPCGLIRSTGQGKGGNVHHITSISACRAPAALMVCRMEIMSRGRDAQRVQSFHQGGERGAGLQQDQLLALFLIDLQLCLRD